jgi:hypothetical protein
VGQAPRSVVVRQGRNVAEVAVVDLWFSSRFPRRRGSAFSTVTFAVSPGWFFCNLLMKKAGNEQ